MATLVSSCSPNPGIACRLAWDLTHSAGASQTVQVYVAGPAGRALRIAFIIVVALIVRALANRLVNRLTERAATASSLMAVRAPGNERRKQRARALGSILGSAISVVVFGTASLTILGDLGIDLTPLLASTAVLGVALGFGAQNLVRDYLGGILILVEDHYGVGDVINLGDDATGTVEAMSLLTTRLRDVNGVVWHVHNGTVDRVGNESQGWSRAVIDYPVPYSSDLTRIRSLMTQAASSMWSEPTWRAMLLEEPEVWGAQELSGSEVTMRIVAKTAPLRQWEAARELRSRVKSTLDAAGVAWPADPETAIDAPTPESATPPAAEPPGPAADPPAPAAS
ncbi:MAG TPA: mechanosensitive ion channel family protein [Streptosporangiaceae bacterium]|jgi:moderate conductance mechanosensitive channel|nr:mechanosensitive ion channel family protein [Streptosporangiaceae bacterium]